MIDVIDAEGLMVEGQFAPLSITLWKPDLHVAGTPSCAKVEYLASKYGMSFEVLLNQLLTQKSGAAAHLKWGQ